MNKGDRSVRCFSQLQNNYGKVRAELGFFKPLVHYCRADLQSHLPDDYLVDSFET